eukprot:CAMPEP_0195059860 /NCGR_PEP_ID=MMETSP0448-20130528/7255_1 /TAXON_ID=66468 /ORGANISM="Heterocapsa triquestra, Strain CCMP 448" /LENGTH=64 /DNA_ID=CAMNT_0040090195 /DNA_START=20 /DNA_END=210 /DNA_ORIENTATION=-
MNRGKACSKGQIDVVPRVVAITNRMGRHASRLPEPLTRSTAAVTVLPVDPRWWAIASRGSTSTR